MLRPPRAGHAPLARSQVRMSVADPVRAQGAIDRFTSNAYDLIIEGESYRGRLKPGRKAGQRAEKKAK